MTKKLAFVLTLSLVFVLVLSGCERSASQSILPTPTEGGEFSLDLTDSETPAAEDAMAELQTFATQTAMAESGSVEATSTPSPESPLPAGTESASLPSPTPTQVAQDAPTPGGTLPTPVVTRPTTYTLLKGEFPFCIARRFNLNQYELLNLNGLSLAQGNNLPVGYTLQIPQTGNPFIGDRTLRAHPDIYTVTGDETIYKVACLYGDVTPEAIITVNNLVAPYSLTIGQQLSIP